MTEGLAATPGKTDVDLEAFAPYGSGALGVHASCEL